MKVQPLKTRLPGPALLRGLPRTPAARTVSTSHVSLKLLLNAFNFVNVCVYMCVSEKHTQREEISPSTLT